MEWMVVRLDVPSYIQVPLSHLPPRHQPTEDALQSFVIRVEGAQLRGAVGHGQRAVDLAGGGGEEVEFDELVQPGVVILCPVAKRDLARRRVKKGKINTSPSAAATCFMQPQAGEVCSRLANCPVG